MLSYSGEKSAILVGPPGTGKFTRSIARTLRTYPGSIIVLDPKGEAAAVTARCRKTLGSVAIFIPFLKRRTVTVYVVMPSREAKDFAHLTRLILSSAMGALLALPRGEVLFIMDEIATALGNQELSIIETGFNQGRGFGSRCQAVLQSWAQGKEIWGERAEAITAGASVMQFMRPNDPVTAARIASRAGVREAQIVTELRSGGSQSSGWSLNTLRQSVPLVRPEELYGIPESRQIIFVEGLSHPILA